jgi:hypothetical protein
MKLIDFDGTEIIIGSAQGEKLPVLRVKSEKFWARMFLYVPSPGVFE